MENNFHVIKHNKDIIVFEGSLTLEPGLNKKGVYELHFNNKSETCSLREESPFVFPDKIYDNDADFRDQVVRTANSIKGNLGIVLEGYKGQGKTFCAKQICNELDLPVIMITKRIPINIDFVSYINSFPHPLVIFIDEFEKNFPKYVNEEGGMVVHSQESFLSFMDGAISCQHKRIFILTTNSDIDDKLMNRPSRIRYFKSYQYMDPEIYEMIIEDRLHDKDFKKDLLENLPPEECTIDLLNTIIDEINLHKKPYSSFKNIFNHRPDTYKYDRYELVNKEWVYVDSIENQRAVSRDTRYLNVLGLSIEVVNIVNSDIIFTAMERKEEGVGFKGKKRGSDFEKRIYKLIPVKAKIPIRNLVL
jgi:hypothetical protein